MMRRCTTAGERARAPRPRAAIPHVDSEGEPMSEENKSETSVASGAKRPGRARRIVVRVIIALVALVVIAVAGLAFMFRNEIATVASIKKVNDYPFYTMTYQGDYGIDEFLEQGGASNDAELIDFVVQHLMKGLPVTIELPDLACSTFNAVTPEGDDIFGRNFDLTYSPSMLVRTDPDNGYASISMVNLGFLGYGEEKLPDSPTSSITALAAPYAPLDGVNEKGLAVGVLLIDTDPTNQQTDKVDITTTTAIRLMLDKCARWTRRSRCSSSTTCTRARTAATTSRSPTRAAAPWWWSTSTTSSRCSRPTTLRPRVPPPRARRTWRRRTSCSRPVTTISAAARIATRS